MSSQELSELARQTAQVSLKSIRSMTNAQINRLADNGANNNNDGGVGGKIRSSSVEPDGLSWPSIGTRERLTESEDQRQERIRQIAACVSTILRLIGEDPTREGLLKTPERYAKALMYFSIGYESSVTDVVNEAVFMEENDEMVIVKNIEIFSLCEHHMVPFMGKVSIGYIPNNKVIGLSKLARLAEMFSRRLQVQERLTRQIAMSLMDTLNPQGVAVTMEASHLCMVMRGVQKPHSSTITSCMLGVFRSDSKTREEFLTLTRK
ncbi:hypothetical protein MP228_003591 [Amoeboaphelidium protococcarum]|nr:hypothetical protein MP228_003591 [Amoeboaphelidium protococcarum]